MPLFAVLGILAILVLLVVGLLLKSKLAGATADQSDTYELRPSLLTPAERSFLGALAQTVPPELAIFAKVRLGDVFNPRKGLEPAARARASNQINRKHVDFLLVRTSDLVPVAGIELDDRSHGRRDRQTRDAFVDGVFAACDLPLLHVPAQSGYRVAELRAELDALLNGHPGRTEEPRE